VANSPSPSSAAIPPRRRPADGHRDLGQPLGQVDYPRVLELEVLPLVGPVATAPQQPDDLQRLAQHLVALPHRRETAADDVLVEPLPRTDPIVVDLDELVVDRISVLSVFPTVALRIGGWPSIPLLLAGSREPMATALRTSAVIRFVTTHPTVALAVAAIGEPPAPRRAVLELTGQPTDARRARGWLSGIGAAWGLGPTGDVLEDALLVASELVENMVQHVPGSGRLWVELRAASPGIAVSDGDPRPPVLVPAGAATMWGGRGMAVVDAIARVWGHSPRPDGGKVAWAVLPSIR
jgi:hypothetical protein